MNSRVSTVEGLSSTVRIAQPQFGAAEREAVERVMGSTALSEGSEVAAFESEFSTFVGGRPCVAVSSGTSALHLGLLAAGAGVGDEVIIPSFTSPATAAAVTLAGATPVFADVEADTLCLDPKSVEALITPRTIGILPVHLFGQIADMTSLEQIARRHRLVLFEDACQAHGARYDGRMAGTFGAVAAFSFHTSKNVAVGEGGMVVCADAALARRVRESRDQGSNARMSDISAAIGRVQLDRLPGFNRVRRMNAALFTAGLRGVETPVVREGSVHVFNQFTIRCAARDQMAAQLAQHGIETSTCYPTPVHRLPAYSVHSDLLESSWASAEVLSLPVHPGVCAKDVLRIVRVVNEIAASGLTG